MVISKDVPIIIMDSLDKYWAEIAHQLAPERHQGAG